MARKKRREPETATIESATHDGRGIAAVSGKKVFVAGALPGETVEFIRRKSRRNFDEAELLQVIEPSGIASMRSVRPSGVAADAHSSTSVRTTSARSKSRH